MGTSEKQKSILSEGSIPKLSDFRDQVVTITEIVGWDKSGYGEYCKLRIEESMDVLVCGNKQCLPKLRKLEDSGELPVRVLIEGFSTKFGKYGINLKEPPPPEEDDGFTSDDETGEDYWQIDDPEV